MKASSDEQEDVMLTKQSTSALPGRLTQVAIYPHLHTYLRRQDKIFFWNDKFLGPLTPLQSASKRMQFFET